MCYVLFYPIKYAQDQNSKLGLILPCVRGGRWRAGADQRQLYVWGLCLLVIRGTQNTDQVMGLFLQSFFIPISAPYTLCSLADSESVFMCPEGGVFKPHAQCKKKIKNHVWALDESWPLMPVAAGEQDTG